MQHLNIITIIASQGDMPQKLSGGGEGDRFVPLYLLADKNKGDFGDIVAFRARELGKGAATDIKDYFDYCRKASSRPALVILLFKFLLLNAQQLIIFRQTLTARK